MNLEQAQKLADLLACAHQCHESNLNMDNWGRGLDPYTADFTKPACGTTLCLWGHAPLAWPNAFEWRTENHVDWALHQKVPEGFNNYEMNPEGFFGLCWEDANPLFYNFDITTHAQLKEATVKVLKNNGFSLDKNIKVTQIKG